jgi:hypothetical protein
MAPRERLDSLLSESEHSQIDAAVEPLHKCTDARRRLVRFGSVQVREYNLTVGDHPEVKVGPPIALGWEYTELEPLELDDYEALYHGERLPFVRRLSSITRKNLLANVFGVPEEEIRAAEKENQRILARSKKMTPAKAVKSARKKLKNVFLGDIMMKGLSAAAGAMMTPMGGNLVF